ncbi:PP2C family protein-serine/threonine phosphatase [Streptomyces sp. NBC_00344]|uniref:PP2C family protein-serine/threonine phosphatase n=1 Tax=Streptomyces sp. NBC_00344 TaxID=2975720 RepID=UPI002E1FCE51
MTDGEIRGASSLPSPSAWGGRTPPWTAGAAQWSSAEGPHGLLDLVDQAVVMCDESGVVHGFNGPAAAVFPQLRTGGPLVEPMASAAARGAERFACVVAGRRLSGHRRRWNGYAVWLVRRDSPVRRDEQPPPAGRGRSDFLEQAGVRLSSSLHHGRTVRALVQAPLPVLADAAVAVLPVPGHRATWHRAGQGAGADSGEMPVAALQGAPWVADALGGRQRRPVVRALGELGDVAALLPQGPDCEGLVIPLSGNGVPVGVLVLVRGPGRQGFDEADIELGEQLAAKAGPAIGASALYSQQARTTAVVQEDLAPAPLPDVDGIVLGAAYRPAAEALRMSGDFYHVAAERDGGVTFFFGDVCGKGAEAALLAGQVRQSLRTLALVESDPLRTLGLLNRALLTSASRFTTLLTGSVLPAPGGGLTVRAAGGGHLPPLVLRGDGRVETVPVEGTLVGILPEAEFGLTEFRLEPGELMLLYSDGVTEARGGPAGNTMYGDERLVRDLATCRGMPAGAVTERVELLTTGWLGGRGHDDITVLAVQAPVRDGGREVR